MSNFSSFESNSNDTNQYEKDYYREALTAYNSWILTGHSWPVLTVVVMYLTFVLKIGPQLMNNRKPLNIQNVILFYNLYQTVSNALLFSKIFTIPGALNHLVIYMCHPMKRSINPYCMPVAEIGWNYLLSKMVDLLDTIFFVLRKKQSHVTFLHVYHHTNMVLLTWYFTKYYHSEQMVIPGLINTFVHVIMYGYYFLAALGPQMQPYLWWKKYVTRLQLLQFIVILAYLFVLMCFNCTIPAMNLMFLGVAQTGIFFVLFVNFYYKTYIAAKQANEKNLQLKND